MDPLKAEAIRLYTTEGRDLRDVAAVVGRSHEWVRLALKAGGHPLRGRGTLSTKPVVLCQHCGKPNKSRTTKFCSVQCFRTRYADKVKEAVNLLNLGATKAIAAKSIGVSVEQLRDLMEQYGYLPVKMPPLR